MVTCGHIHKIKEIYIYIYIMYKNLRIGQFKITQNISYHLNNLHWFIK